jgi:RNA polymerase sigma factor (sigma-70 family)
MATAPTKTDAELVRGLQARDRAAWEELYAEYHPRLRAFGYRLVGNAHDADDLAQETFVRALPALDRLDPETTDLGGYLFATAKNLFLKQVERAKRAEPTAEVPEPDLPSAIEDDPERSALLARQQEEVRIANARLDPRQRLVLALCELEDRSYAEIGDLVGLNENAVAQLVFRARERLRTELRLVQVDPENLPEECRAYLPLLAQHLDGKLRSPKLEATLAHLEGCERCQAALADMREAKRRYRALLLPPLGVPAEEARAAVEADLERVGYWTGRGGRAGVLRRPRRTAAVAGAVTAGALLCLAGGLGAAALLVDAETSSARRAVSTAAPSTTEPATTAPPPTSTQEPKPEQPKPRPTSQSKTKPAPVTAPKPEPTTTEAVTTSPEPEVSPPPPPPPSPEPAPKVSPPPIVTGDKPLRGQSPDTTAPTVTIGQAPATASPATSATFTFTANEARVAFSCRLDGRAWQPCTSPRALDAALGTHTFDVRGTDAAGNIGPSATHRWTVTPPPDTTAPTVTLTQTPPATTPSRTATFAFTASEAGATFACSYDGGPYLACTSAHTIQDAGVDDHTFAVRATDAAGNTGAPALARWTVVVLLPDLVAVLTDTSVTVRNVGEGAGGASLVTVASVGTFSIPALASGQAVTRTYACVRGTITATADYAKGVTEANEDNNTTTRRVSCIGLVG